MSNNLLPRKNFIVKPLALAVVLGTVASAEVFAAESLALEEVIVTAQKRDQSLQDVPISMAVLGSTALENLGVNGLEDFAALLPSMNYVSLGPGSGNVYMRGISSGGESLLGSNPNVAVYMDEQPVTAVGAFLNPHIYDIERIETLAGPQGTLFGANAQAGSIRIITKKPVVGEFSAGYDVELNSIDDGDNGTLFEGFVNVPLGDSAAVRVVAWRKDEAGYIDNVAGSHTFDYQYIRDGLDPAGAAIATDKTISNEKYVEDNFNEATTTGFRGNLLVDLNENWTVTAGVMRQELESEGVWDHDPDDVGDLEVVRFNPDSNDDEWTQLSLVVEGKIGDMTLTYAGSDMDRDSYQQADYSLYADSRLSPGYTSTYYSCYVAATGACGDPSILFTSDNEYERTNHELRLASSQESKLRWLVGVFYEDASHAFDLEWHIPSIEGLTYYGLSPIAVEAPDIYWTTDQKRSNEETAYFGELSYDITEDLTVSYSTRYFDYDSQLIGFSGTFWWPDRFGPRVEKYNTNLKTNDKDHVGKFNISYNINDDIMVYGTWSEGYRPGGLNRVYDTPVGGTYEPDFLTSYEVGAKTVLMDGRLRLNVAAYQQEWDDFQLSKIDTDVSVLVLTDNVGSADSDGVEVDGSFRITDNWDVNFGLSYIDSTLSESYWINKDDEGVTDPEAKKGTELPRVPDLKWNISSRYNFQVMDKGAFVQGTYTYTGESYNLLYGTSDTRERSKQDSYDVLNLAVGLETDSWSAEFFVANATDERGEVFINGASYDQRVTTNRPRTFGLRFRQMFN
jgi:outer membrane receptor protein involved in Fe transport